VNRIEDLLRSVAATQQRTAGTRASIDGLSAMLRAKQAAQGVVPPGAVRPPGASAPAPAMGHNMGDGHNHPKGSVPTEKEAEELWNRVNRMIKDSPHKITPGARSRSYAEQVRLWNLYKAGKGAMAAKPGTSKHGTGRANDLQYSSEAARQWALANASKYGLAMPLYNPKLGRGRDESWHVELG
jgi:hypothetical protein